MKKSTIAILSGVGLLWYKVLRGVQAIKISMPGFRLAGISLNQLAVSLQLDFKITNPLWVGLTLKGIDGEVFLNGEKIGVVNNIYDYYIAGNATHIVHVIATIAAKESVEAMVANIQSGNIQNLTLQYVGHITVGDLTPVRIKINKLLTYNDLIG